jgi:PAS domain S-box-containing protein
MKNDLAPLLQSCRDRILSSVVADEATISERVCPARAASPGVLDRVAASVLDLVWEWIHSPQAQTSRELMDRLVQSTFFTGQAGEVVNLFLSLKRAMIRLIQDHDGEAATESVTLISETIDRCLLEFNAGLMGLFRQVVARMVEHLQSYMAKTADLVLLFQLDTGAILDANMVAEQILGYSKTELQQKKLFDLVPEPWREVVDLTLRELKQTHLVNLREIELVTEDGRAIPVTFNPVLREYLAPQLVIANFNNLAQKKELQRQLQQRAAELQRTVGEQMQQLQQREREIQQRNQRLTILNTIAATVGQSLDLEQILNDALEKVLELTEIESGALSLVDERAGELVIRAHRGLSPKVIEAAHRMKLGDGFGGRVAVSGELLVADDIATDPRLSSPAVKQEGYHFLVCIPLKAKGKVLGVISAVSRNPQRLSAEQVQMLISISEVIGVAIDNARLYEQLLISEAKYRHIFEEAAEGIYQCAPDGTLLTANPALAQMLGYDDVKELLRQNLLELYPTPADRRRWHQQLKREGIMLNDEVQLRRRDGRLIWVQNSARGVRDAQGNVLWYEGAAMDITARKQAEEALRESEEKYRDLVENINDIIFAADERGVVTYVSPSIEPLSGFAPADVIGRSFAEFIHPDDLSRLTESFQKVLSGQMRPREYRVMNKSGEIRWVRSSSRSIFQGDRAVGLQGVLTDITDRKRAEEEIKKLNGDLERRVLERTAQLEAANKELEAFSYSVSHDLRAPLRHIGGFVDLLEKQAAPVLDEKSRRYLKLIWESKKKMDNLIDDLLIFSRMGRTEMRQTRISLQHLLDAALHDLQQDTQGRDIVWKIGPLPEVHGDPSMLRLVLVNLLSNALKFTSTRPQAEIEIGCHSDRHDEVVFSIRDNGVGFDMQYVDKLFGVFQRLHREDEFEGTGIGLANVRRIIHRHGGRTWAEGLVDGGAMICFSLPISENG